MTSVITAASFGNWSWYEGIRRLAGIVTLVVLLALAFSLARLTWSLIEPTPSQSVGIVEPAVVAPVRVGTEAVRPAVESVAQLHLFGRATPGERAPAATIDAPDTRLRLQLRGVVALPETGLGVAFIADESGEERHYAPGADLPGGATLEQVHVDRVILRRDGRYEQLRLPRDAPLSGEAPAARPVAAVTGGAREALPAELRQQWLEEPTQFFEMVQVQPVLRDGAIHGFALSPRREPRLFRALGLRPGDVVTAINGVVVAGMSDPMALRDQLSGAMEIRLDIERNGEPDTVTIPIGN